MCPPQCYSSLELSGFHDVVCVLELGSQQSQAVVHVMFQRNPRWIWKCCNIRDQPAVYGVHHSAMFCSELNKIILGLEQSSMALNVESRPVMNLGRNVSGEIMVCSCTCACVEGTHSLLLDVCPTARQQLDHCCVVVGDRNHER